MALSYTENIIYKIKKGNVEYEVQDAVAKAAIEVLQGDENTTGSIAKAIKDGAIQTVVEGQTNGTIAVDGTDVAVHGLGSAAYTASSAYDVSGSASTAETNAKAYADGLASNYDASGSASAAETAAKAYTDTQIQALAGQDWTAQSRKVQEIINEIENSENANGWTTAIDKLAGLGNKTEAVYYTQAECDAANVSLTGFVTTSDTNPDTGVAYTTEEANAHNATLEGAIKTTDVKTAAVANTVKDYVDASISGQTQSSISNGVLTLGL